MRWWPHRGSERATRLTGENVHVQFRGLKALGGVDLSLERGEILGLIGPNGAGKTTLVNVLTGYQRATIGELRIDDEIVKRPSAALMTRGGVVRTFQSTRLFRALTVRENVEMGAVGCGASRADAAEFATEILSRFDLQASEHHPAGALPHGSQRLVGIGRALATGPSFLLLDEPAAGLNEVETRELAQTLRELVSEFDLGMLVIEHDVPMVMSLCDRMQVLDAGVTLASGTPSEVRSHEGVIAAYLGPGVRRAS